MFQNVLFWTKTDIYNKRFITTKKTETPVIIWIPVFSLRAGEAGFEPAWTVLETVILAIVWFPYLVPGFRTDKGYSITIGCGCKEFFARFSEKPVLQSKTIFILYSIRVLSRTRWAKARHCCWRLVLQTPRRYRNSYLLTNKWKRGK